MAIIRWEPTRGLQSFQQDVDRLFGAVFDSHTGATRVARRWIPAVDLVEENDEFLLRADLPGVAEQDVKVELDHNVLTISGERKAQSEERKDGYYRLERASGNFARSLRLPEGVDAAGIKANFDNGVLEVRVPKPVSSKPHRVPITAGGQPEVTETAS
jgi:HSP20 family protein